MNRSNSQSSLDTWSYHSENTVPSDNASLRVEKTSARLEPAKQTYMNPQPAKQNSALNEEEKDLNRSNKLKAALKANSSSKVDTISAGYIEEYYSLMTKLEMDKEVEECKNFLSVFEQKMILEMLKNPDLGFKFKDKEKQEHAERLIYMLEFIIQYYLDSQPDGEIYEKYSKTTAEQKLKHLQLIKFLEDIIKLQDTDIVQVEDIEAKKKRNERKSNKQPEKKLVDLAKIKKRLETKNMEKSNQVKYQIEFIEGYSIASENNQFKNLKRKQEQQQNQEEEKKYKKKHVNMKKDIDKYKQRNK